MGGRIDPRRRKGGSQRDRSARSPPASPKGRAGPRAQGKFIPTLDKTSPSLRWEKKRDTKGATWRRKEKEEKAEKRERQGEVEKEGWFG